MLQRFVDPVAIAAQIKHVQAMHCGGSGEHCSPGRSRSRQHGYIKNHRPDLRQMILAVLIDGDGRPVCSEMWPGNTADVDVLIPVIDRLRRRFDIAHVCMVADRGTHPRSMPGGKEAIAAEARARRKAGYVPAEEVRYNQRSSAERVNGRLKDEFGARILWVRGHAKVFCHLMFGVLALSNCCGSSHKP